ncbi:MAG: tRNA (adenosine(37)-N6)-threonylcarbamoyltransferase complex dimerization subunit type 1 TsaB [Bacteroidetes bacterium]|nr:MAG: tRNA (adenosine(37)-N6)-threonylcarbamoyltransferase complex dimerization subunit type 1 TsaB [Bacteroidota bacterium]
MGLILCIDTSGATGSVSIAADGALLGELSNPLPTEHAAFLQPAVQLLTQRLGLQLAQIDAVAVSNGPGSYTGLRVGLASAKGICFALGKPLIALSSLQIMAKDASQAAGFDPKSLICPMIDARRMEVFYGLYLPDGTESLPAKTAVLTPDFLENYLEKQPVSFVGNGVEKWQTICTHINARFATQPVNLLQAMAQLAQHDFEQGRFADTAYAEPFYAKAFYTPLSAK